MGPPSAYNLKTRIRNRIAVAMAPILTRGSGPRLLSAFENNLAFLQGKGSGDGWDMRAEIAVAVPHVKGRDPIVFDVGANMGEWSAGLFKALRGRECRFFLFEPSSACVTRLHALGLPRAIFVQAAVSDRDGEADFYFYRSAHTLSSLYWRRDSLVNEIHGTSPVEATRVTVVTIDGIMRQYGIPYVDFMKIDTEGNDLAVLRGASEALRGGRINAFSFEFGASNVNSRTFFRDFWDLLHPLGFDIKRICPGGTLLPINEYDERLEYFRRATNYVAFREGRRGS